MKKIFFVFVILLFISSCKEDSHYFWEEPEPYEENLAKGKVIDYTKHSLYEVTSSDSLASIARKYGTTSQALIIMNNLEKPYNLKPGMLIKVPTIRTAGISPKEEEAAKNNKIIQIEPSKKK